MHILHKPSVSIHLYNYAVPINMAPVPKSVFELTIGLVSGDTSCHPVDYNKKIFLVYQTTRSFQSWKDHTL